MAEILLEKVLSFKSDWYKLSDYQKNLDPSESDRFYLEKGALHKGILKYLEVRDKQLIRTLMTSVKNYGFYEDKNPCLYFLAALRKDKVDIHKPNITYKINALMQKFISKKPSWEDLVKTVQNWAQESEKEIKKVKTPYDIKNGEITNELLDAFKAELTYEDKKKFLREKVFTVGKFATMTGIQDILIESILDEGLDPRRNLFLGFVLQIPFGMQNEVDYNKKMRYIYNSYLNKKLDLDLEVLKNQSLYTRSDKEFEYTLNVFNLLSNSATASNYLKNTKVINFDELMDGNIIKPAGLDRQPGDTIFNKIEEWAQDNEVDEKERREKDSDTKNFSKLSSILTQNMQNYRQCHKIIKENYGVAECDVDELELLRLVYTAFSLIDVESHFKELAKNSNLIELTQVDSLNVSQIKSDPAFKNAIPQGDVAPATVYHLPNVSGQPSILFLFNKILPLEIKKTFVANDEISKALNLKDDLLNFPVKIKNKKDEDMDNVEIVKAFNALYKESETLQILNYIWKENL